MVLIDKVYRQGTLIRRLINPFRTIWLTFISLNKEKTYGIYLTCGQTAGGIIRDVIIGIFARLYRVPVILHLHGGGIKELYDSKGKFFKMLMRNLYQNANKIIVLGQSLFDQFYFLLDRSNIIIVPNSYYPDVPKITDMKLKYDRINPIDKLKILFLSHVLPSKGFFDILDALLIIKRDNYFPFEFNFAGELIGEDSLSAANIKEIINKQYLPKFNVNEFIIHGFISGADKWKLIIESNILILPTQFYAEGQPISIIEAMYGGCCIVTTNYRGIPDLVKENVNGWFVEPKNPESIASCLIGAWKDPETTKKIGFNNHIEALNKYSPDRFINDMSKIINNTFNIDI